MENNNFIDIPTFLSAGDEGEGNYGIALACGEACEGASLCQTQAISPCSLPGNTQCTNCTAANPECPCNTAGSQINPCAYVCQTGQTCTNCQTSQTTPVENYHKTLVEGTEYKVHKGTTLVNGTKYSIAEGKTLVEGTARTIPLISELVIYDGGDSVLVGTFAAHSTGTVTTTAASIADGYINAYGFQVIEVNGTCRQYLGGIAAISYWDVGPIDITKYKTLHIIGSAGTGMSSTCGIHTQSATTSSFTKSTTLSTTVGEKTIDISSQSGNYYIKCYAYAQQRATPGVAKISKIWLTEE